MRSVLPRPPERPKLDSSMFIVNIVLLLILFFLATGRLLNEASLGVDLSETEELPVERLPRPLLVLRGDAVELNGTPVAAADLPRLLEDVPRVHLLVAREAPASGLVELLGQPGLEGIEVRLVTVRAREAAP